MRSRRYSARLEAYWILSAENAPGLRQAHHPLLTGLLKQLRDELVQILAPHDPCMGAGGFVQNNAEPMLLEHLDRGTRRSDQKVISAGCKPDEFQSLFQLRVVERLPVLLLPTWSR